MRQIIKHLCAPLLLAAVCLSPAIARQQQTPPPTTGPTTPVAPVAPTAAAGKTATKQEEPASPVVGSPPTVTGSLAPNVGDTGDAHSELTAGLIFSELFDSNYQNLNGSSGWNELTTIGGHMELHRMGAGNDLIVRYVGGGYIDPKNSAIDTSYHQLDASESFQFRRWTLTLDDVFSSLPQSAFGFGGAGLSGGIGIGITILNPFVLPNQSILTNQGKRISNVALAQAQVNATPRSSWTFTGSYGLLHFTNPINLDPTNGTFAVGYNYQLSPRDTIGVSYQFTAIRFTPPIQSINDNSVQVTYGHHISDRLIFQAGIGPDMYTSTPLFGPSNGLQTSLGANASLAYQLNHTSLNAAFTRGVSNGAGVIAGATSTGVVFSVSHHFGQWTTVNGAIGYASNHSLPQAAVATTNYNGVNASAGFTRQLSRSFSVNASYNLLNQSTNAPACSGVSCAGPVLRHQIWVGFSWDMHAVPLR
jgi:hypothetical protein